MEQNIASTQITLLDGQIKALNDASSAITLVGDRYAAETIKRVGL